MTDKRVDWKVAETLYCDRENGGPGAFLAWCYSHFDEIKAQMLLEYPGRDESPLSGTDMKLLEMSLIGEHASKGPATLDRCIIHQSEHGLPGVLCLVPPGSYSCWYRYDDAIDWEEETRVYKQMHRVAVLLNCGIYPYNSGMIRFRKPKKSFRDPAKEPIDLKRWDEWGPLSFDHATYSQLVGWWDPANLPPIAKGAFLRHLQRDFRPRLPFDLVALAMWSGIFTSPDTLNDLRPMLYVYWS